MVRCAGCNGEFSLSGLSKHYGQTQQLACLDARDALHSSAAQDPAPTLSLSTSPQRDSDLGHMTSPIEQFSGDYFGEYEGDSFADEPTMDSNDPLPPLVADDSTEDDDYLRTLRDDLSDSDDEEELELQPDWEPAREGPVPHSAAGVDYMDDALSDSPIHHNSPAPANAGSETHAVSREAAERSVRTKTFVVRYCRRLPSGHALVGEKVLPAYTMYKTTVDGEDRCIYAPFRSRIDWEVARWAKMRGPGSNAGSELLGIDGLADALGLSFKSMTELNKIIDDHLPAGRPRFKRREIIVQGEAFEFYYRDVLECLRALFGDPEFARDLLLVPERHYTDASRQARVYFDMNTGDWWWRIQRLLDRRCPGGTVIPVIISSDKTQLTVFGNKTAYPVYLTIGNLPKDIRRKPSHRGQVLLAYLPTSNLEHITNQASRRRTLLNLFHACMRHVLAPLQAAGEHGVAMARGDGVMFRCHPILAAYVGDYPEQILVACCKKGDCPKCPIPRDELGNSTDTERAIRDIDKVLDAMDTYDDGPTAYNNACQDVGIKPVIRPFWQVLPYVDIYASITPDILHQLYQGVVKHLISWIKSAYGSLEIDARCRRLPPNHHLRYFSKGISKLQRVTGKEHADICRILLGLVIELPLPQQLSPSRLVRATRSLLDFLYIAQYPIHTSATTSLLRDALVKFHANKGIFVDLGIRSDFHFPNISIFLSPAFYQLILLSVWVGLKSDEQAKKRSHRKSDRFWRWSSVSFQTQ
ncbi:hypothetical protein NUW54_g471 [Trametes sanguinea]|uniref:Uncharacterized protein n=1 Tax=Trametes sanguinea TaxID=158606 RepID=A0ACC1Q928_9APHY|nr:hypothetical protein NUW54_g471 [Trametes sanguinea]